MARKSRAKQVELIPDAGLLPVDVQVPGMIRTKVTPVHVETARFITIDGGHPVWHGEHAPDGFVAEGCKGAFVRVRPPKGAEERARVVEEMARRHALGVKVERPRADAVVAERKAREPHKSARAVVEAMRDESSSKDKGALGKLLEDVMGEESL